MFEAARLLSFYNGYIDFPQMDSEKSGFFIVKHVFKLVPKLHKAVGLFTPMTLQYNLKILQVGNTSVLISSKLTDGENGEFLGENIFKYIFVDRKTRRPKHFPDWWSKKYRPYSKQDSVQGMAKSVLPNTPDHAFRYSFKARHSDTDKNGHVNNSVYLKLCIDCGTFAAKSGHYTHFESDLCFYSALLVEANYLGESKMNDELDVFTWQDTKNKYLLYFMVYHKDNQVFYTSIIFDSEKTMKQKPKL